MSDRKGQEGTQLPQFTDVKMLVDSLLIEYQTNRTMHYEFERNAMICAPYRADYLYSECISSVKTSLNLLRLF